MKTLTKPPVKKNKLRQQQALDRDLAKAQAEFDRFMALSDQEKTRDADAAAALPAHAWTPVSKAEWKLLQSMGIGSARAGRPRKGRGSKPVSVTMELGLLEQVDKYARAHGMTRAQLVAESLRLAMKQRIGLLSVE